MSVGELVGFANHAETLHIPHHTPRERAYFYALRCLARIRLHDLCSPDAPRESFSEFSAVPAWRRAHTAVLEYLFEHRPRWIARALIQMQRFSARLAAPQFALSARRRKAGPSPSRPAAGAALKAAKPREERVFVIDNRPTSEASLRDQLSRTALDPEW